MSDIEALAAALARRQARTQMVREQAGREMDGPGWREQLSRLTGAMLTAPGSPGRELFNSALAGMRSIAPGGEPYANELGYIRQEAEDQHPGAYSVVPDVRRLAQVMANREDMTNLAPGMAAPIVFHGTPARWAPEPGAPLGQFRRSFKHTGEGGAYKGAGGYVAESPHTGESYRVGLATKGTDPALEINGQAVQTVAPDTDFWPHEISENREIGYAMRHGRTAEEALYLRKAEARAQIASYESAMMKGPNAAKQYGPVVEGYKRRLAYLDSIDPATVKLNDPTGSFYELEYPDELLPRTLDFDKTLADQTPEVQQALRRADLMPTAVRAGDLMKGENPFEGHWTYSPDDYAVMLRGKPVTRAVSGYDPAQMTGEELYHALVDMYGGRVDSLAAEDASRALAGAGIPAHRFLDAGSRGDGNGTHNYVVYEPDKNLRTRARFDSFAQWMEAQKAAGGAR